MTNNFDNIQSYIEQTSIIINLPIDEQSMSGVVDNFTRIAELATLVTEFEFPEAIEAATIFKP